MIKAAVNSVYEMNKITDDPRFEGFALSSQPSLLGRDCLDDDLTPGFADAESHLDWKQPQLSHLWKPVVAEGRVTEFNDYPCVDMTLPAFSQRAVDALSDLLEPNGELLPLVTKTSTTFYLYNILRVSDALDRGLSDCTFFCSPPTTAVSIDFFAFDKNKLVEHAIFRIRELPSSVFVTNIFAERIALTGLNGFDLTQVWPLPKGVNWRLNRKGNRNHLKELKNNSVIVVLNLPLRTIHSEQLRAFEDSMDVTLRVKKISDKYVGCYEGSESLPGEFRMFFSCPDADVLFATLLEPIRQLNWPEKITVFKRYGTIYDKMAEESYAIIK